MTTAFLRTCELPPSHSHLPFRSQRPIYRTSLRLGQPTRARPSLSARATAAAAAAGGELKKGIAEFYDESSGIWEDVWGDHMHHGYYERDVPADISDHRSAQIRMVEEALRFAGVSGEFTVIPFVIFYLHLSVEQ